MKYYLKATNTKTNKTIIIPTLVFISRKKAQEFANEFMASFDEPIAKIVVIKENER